MPTGIGLLMLLRKLGLHMSLCCQATDLLETDDSICFGSSKGEERDNTLFTRK